MSTMREPREIILGDETILSCTFARAIIIDTSWQVWIGVNNGVMEIHAGSPGLKVGTGNYKHLRGRQGSASLTNTDTIKNQLANGGYTKAELDDIYRLLYAMGCRINR